MNTDLQDSIPATANDWQGQVRGAKRSILIVDDNSFFSKCLATLIDHENDLKVCSIATSYAHLCQCLNEKRPELLLMDVCIGPEDGVKIARTLRSLAVDVPILLTSSVAEPTRQDLDEIGRCAFVSKFQKPVDFLNQIREFLD